MRPVASPRARPFVELARTGGRRPPRTTALGGLITALASVLLTLVALVGLAGTAAATTEPCAPSPDIACLGGTIRTSTGEPATGVQLTIEGPETHSAVTDDTGRWSVALAAAGDYTVTVDVATLPPGETLRDPANNPRTVTATLSRNAGVLFPLGEPTGAPPSDEGPSDDGAVEPGPGENVEPGLDTPVPGSTSGSVNWDRVAQQASAGLVFGTLLALASVGLSLIFGTTGLSNFAHGELVTFGGIIAYVFTQLVGLPLLASAVIAVALGAVLGWVQDVAMWQPLRRLRTGLTQQLIVTIGLAITMQYIFQFFFGAGSLRIIRYNPETVTFGPVYVTQQSLISLAISAVVLGGLGYFLVGTRVGRATRAVSDNPALAAASGIGVDGIIRMVWIVGSALAALGGVLMGLYLNATAWNMGSTLLMLIFAAVTLGGLGTAFGAVVGSIVIGLVVELSNLVIPSDMRYAGALVILIVVLLFRPQGILGRAERIG